MITPFFSMPENVETLLTKQEYINAILHPKGVFGGFIHIIHSSPLHPEWGNLIIPEEETDYAYVYTEDGWKKDDLYNKIWLQLFNEYVNCVHYYTKNEKEIMKAKK